jgi:hypothetical protein
MRITLTHEMRDSLARVGHVPDDLRHRIEAIAPVAGTSPPAWVLTLSEDEAMELSELLQWHVRSDPSTGRPTGETAPLAAIIAAIAEQQF